MNRDRLTPPAGRPQSGEPRTRRAHLCLSATFIGLVGLYSALCPWIAASAQAERSTAAVSHWAFQPLRPQRVPSTAPSNLTAGASTPIDRFVSQKLHGASLALNQSANAQTLVRRVAFVLTGLPPSPAEIETFVADRRPGAFERMVERYLASPRYGERWGKHWLDVAGYADSNGYFNADTDRPYAYRYRDYVIRSFNQDLPFDQFVREQIAGDELSGWKPGHPATAEIVRLLEATHYLRNGQDGSGESDGNPDEVRTDRYYALESAMQIMGSSLLGVTLQCAKCHDHKFEPISQKDYYSFQAFLYPAFHIEKWTKPNDRVVQAALPGQAEAWQADEKRLDQQKEQLQAEFSAWSAAHRPRGELVFQDSFEPGHPLRERWSNTAPGDDIPSGSPAVQLDSSDSPGAEVRDGRLWIREGGGSGDRWLSTKATFDWKPAADGQWIQASFDLVSSSLALDGQGGGAERIGYLIAAHDFNDNSEVRGGNILIDGNPGGATAVHTDYPGSDAQSKGNLGASGYKPGHNYGIRITRRSTNEFLLEHLYDGAVDGESLKLSAEDLPRGGFAFEYCCGRSFIVDNVAIERSNESLPGWAVTNAAFAKLLKERKKTLETATKAIAAQRTPKPGMIAWMTDSGPEAPQVRLLERGNHKTPGEPVEPVFFSMLAAKPPHGAGAFHKTATTTGRRTAWAQWLTEPDSVQAALLARVTVNRIWQHCFEIGLVATPENLGVSGSKPSHPELLDWLARQFIESGWSTKAVVRLILHSATFQQSSRPHDQGIAADPANQLLWRYPIHRLDAESIRDATLAVAGRLGPKTGGPYVPTPRDGSGEVLVDESKPEAFSRSVFLQHRRTQVPTFLGNFDAPSVVFNCTRRASTTMPLQSLSLLNSEFSVKRAEDFAERLRREAGTASDARQRIRQAFLLSAGREPDAIELAHATQFITEQRRVYSDRPDAEQRTWADLCQSLLSLNSFLYLE